MVKRESWFYLLCWFLAVDFLPANTELQLVHVVFRHGKRTPTDSYPNDPYINFKYPPYGFGALVNQGKLDQYRQGQFLRTRYNELLGDLYTPEVIYAQTSDMDRTKMSAQLELAGLWPPSPSQLWNPDLHWQPIPLHSQPIREDTLLVVTKPCPRYDYEREKVVNSKEVQDILKAYSATKLYKFVSQKTGLTLQDTDDIMLIYSTLKAQEGFNLRLPGWTNEIYPEKILPLNIFSYIVNAYNTELQKLKAGPLVKKIIDDTKAKAEGTLQPEGRKMFMYSAHDITVVNLMSALKVWDPQEPVYGIMVLIELHHDEPSDSHYVKLFLRNSTEHEPYALTMPGCETSCPLEQFISLTSPVVSIDWEEDCKIDDPNYVRLQRNHLINT